MYTDIIKSRGRKTKNLSSCFNLRRKLESTIGLDSFVKIGELQFINDDEVELSIIADYNLKAQSLINILIDTYYFSHNKLKIRVFDNKGNEYYKNLFNQDNFKNEIKNNFELALMTNTLVIRVLESTSSESELVVEVSKKVIQLLDIESEDIFNNKSYIAEEIFNELIISEYSDLKVNFTTTLNRDIFIEEIKDECPWLLDYSFLKALFRNDYDITIMPIYNSDNSYFIDIIVNSNTKALALSTVLNNYYSYKDSKLFLQIFSNADTERMVAINSEIHLEELLDTYKIAFYSNEYIKYILGFSGDTYPSGNNFSKEIVIVLDKEVVQIFNNSDDYYGNLNILPTELLERAVKKSIVCKNDEGVYYHININTSIEYNRNVIS